jgi:hypothetical protein
LFLELDTNLLLLHLLCLHHLLLLLRLVLLLPILPLRLARLTVKADSVVPCRGEVGLGLERGVEAAAQGALRVAAAVQDCEETIDTFELWVLALERRLVGRCRLTLSNLRRKRLELVA